MDKKKQANKVLSELKEAGQIRTNPAARERAYELALSNAAQVTGEKELVGDKGLQGRIATAQDLLIKILKKKPSQAISVPNLKQKQKEEKEPEEEYVSEETLAKQGEEKNAAKEETKEAVTGETTRLVADDETKRLANTNETTRLGTQKLPDIPSGGPANIGATQDLSGYQVMYPTPTISSPRSAAKAQTGVSSGDARGTVYKTQYEKYKARVSSRTQNKMQEIARGDYGFEWRDAARDDPKSVETLIEDHYTQRLIGSYVVDNRTEAILHKDIPEVKTALENIEALESELKSKNLLKDEWQKDERFNNYYTSSSGGIHETTMDSVSFVETLPRERYIEEGVRTQQNLLHVYNRLQPEDSQQLGIPQVLQNIPRPQLQRGELPSVEKILPRLGKAKEEIATKVTEKFASSAAGKAFQAGTAEATKKLTAAAAGKGIVALLARLGLQAGAAFLSGGVTLLITMIPSIVRLVRKFGKEVIATGLGVAGLGALSGSILLGGLGVGIAGVGLYAGGVGLSGMGSYLSAFFSTIGKLLVAALFLPLILSLAGVSALVAFILLIINNSSYVTPFAPELAIVQSPNSNQAFNLKVTKKALSGSQFNNGPFPMNVEYEITIEALKGDLSNLVFNNSYQITQQPLVAVAPQVTLPNPPSSISGGQTYTFKYIASYPDTFRDSYVCDTFEVAANAGGTRDANSATACITIGKSPITVSCPSGWPVELGSGRRYRLTQGFDTWPKKGSSHGTKGPEEAVDITREDQNNLRPDDYIITTHDGIVQKIGKTQFGNRVQVIGVCNGQTFVSYYGHLRDAGFAQGLTVGQQIPKGTRIGLVGNTGAKGLAYHLHYAFYPDKGVAFMGTPFIPLNRTSIQGCLDFAACGSIIIQ